jgi:hypothetical protein
MPPEWTPTHQTRRLPQQPPGTCDPDRGASPLRAKGIAGDWVPALVRGRCTVPYDRAMSDDTAVHAGEPPLLAFISSVMDEELYPARQCVERVLSPAPFLFPWAFERTPASSQDVDVSYLEKVRRSAFVFWLVAGTTTDPVKAEVEEALASHRRLIVVKLPAEERDATTRALLEHVGPHVKYCEVSSIDELARDIYLAVSDEINRALQDLPGMGRIARLDELGRASRARCLERWEVAGVDTVVALELADDVTVGVAPDALLPDEDRPLRVLRGDMGVGKSIAAERFHQAAIAAQLTDATAPVPVYLRAREAGDDLEAKVLSRADGLGDPRQQGSIVVVDGIDDFRLSRLHRAGRHYEHAGLSDR